MSARGRLSNTFDQLKLSLCVSYPHWMMIDLIEFTIAGASLTITATIILGGTGEMSLKSTGTGYSLN